MSRIASALLALALGAGLATAGVGQAHATTPQGPASGFEACPELPPKADPAAWRCEVMSATGHLTLGRIDVPIDEPMTVTHAEGRIDGEFAQVFGALSAEPIAVPGTRLTITPRYAGYFDFHTNAERLGELDLKFAVSGPGLPSGCSIGRDTDAVHLVLKTPDGGGPGATPSIEDTRFAAPRTSGCGPRGRVLDRFLRLPSSSGKNAIHLDGERAVRSYSDLDVPAPQSQERVVLP
ncbi:hypothetical protein ACWY4P_25925 [Streptomyces sp. LZ34]